MDSKSVVKIFKRKDLESSINQTSEINPSDPINNPGRIERRSRRELVNTVSNWVTERRERSQTEEIEGLRRIFGDSVPSLSGA
jgi:hypothetical protein